MASAPNPIPIPRLLQPPASLEPNLPYRSLARSLARSLPNIPRTRPLQSLKVPRNHAVPPVSKAYLGYYTILYLKVQYYSSKGNPGA